MDMSMLQSPDGKTSMMRVTTLMVVVSVMGVFIAHNVMSMIHGTGFISLGASEALLIAGVLGIKAGQAYVENKSSSTASTDDAEVKSTSTEITNINYTPKVPDSAKE